MEIQSVLESKIHYVQTPAIDYIRFGPDNWVECIGESHETVFDCDLLESTFQEYQKNGGYNE